MIGEAIQLLPAGLDGPARSACPKSLRGTALILSYQAASDALSLSQRLVRYLPGGLLSLHHAPQPLFRRPGGLNELQVHRTRSEVTISFIVPRASSTSFEPAYTRSAGSPISTLISLAAPGERADFAGHDRKAALLSPARATSTVAVNASIRVAVSCNDAACSLVRCDKSLSHRRFEMSQAQQIGNVPSHARRDHIE